MILNFNADLMRFLRIGPFCIAIASRAAYLGRLKTDHPGIAKVDLNPDLFQGSFSTGRKDHPEETVMQASG